MMNLSITETLLALSRSTELAILGKATLLLAAGLVVSYLAGRWAASVRHLVLATTFGTLLALPFVVISAPEVAIGVPVSAGISLNAESINSSTAVLSEAGSSAGPGLQQARSWVLASWKELLLMVWVAGALLMTLRLAVDLWRLRLLRRTSIPALELCQRMQELVAESGIRRPVELLLHDDIPAPLTCGIWRPAILLPADAFAWNADDLRRALIHELEHVRRADWVIQLLARAACTCYWFHPLVWVASRRLALDAERACDDAVVRTEESTAYAQQLVLLARRMSHTQVQVALGMAQRSDLSTRVTSVLDASQSRGRSGLLTATAVLGVAGIVLFAIGPIRAVAQSSIAKTSEPT
ncbi:MAG: M56 family metallopeptidase, partial [Bryobacteraceae bacterium]|nr:M56 family metallopeptidase [Bryobacteraceae bacterium]